MQRLLPTTQLMTENLGRVLLAARGNDAAFLGVSTSSPEAEVLGLTPITQLKPAAQDAGAPFAVANPGGVLSVEPRVSTWGLARIR
jgi:hypothetical protein